MHVKIHWYCIVTRCSMLFDNLTTSVDPSGKVGISIWAYLSLRQRIYRKLLWKRKTYKMTPKIAQFLTPPNFKNEKLAQNPKSVMGRTHIQTSLCNPQTMKKISRDPYRPLMGVILKRPFFFDTYFANPAHLQDFRDLGFLAAGRQSSVSLNNSLETPQSPKDPVLFWKRRSWAFQRT